MHFSILLITILYLLYRKQHQNNCILLTNVVDETNININKCNACENCISCNINLKCLNKQLPWKGLLIPEQIDSSIDKVKYILY